MISRFCYALLTLHLAVSSIGAAALAQESATEPETSIAINGGFEEGAKSWELAPTAQVDDTTAHSGKRSLRYTNTDPANYKLLVQRIMVQPGDTVSFSVWVKGQEIVSAEPNEGAGAFVESSDGAGKWLTGAYPPGFSGTFDWKQCSGTYVVPATAKTVVMGLYLNRKSVGTVWFDDVEVRVRRRAPFEVFFDYPNYRGLVPRNDGKPWRARLRVLESQAWKSGSIPFKSTLTDSTGKVLLQRNGSIPSQNGEQTISLVPPRGLANGGYRWQVEVTDPAGKIKTTHLTVRVVDQMPRVYIDDSGFTVVEGKRFFPLGLYLGATTGDHLQRIAAAKFNTVLSYNNDKPVASKEYLDRAQQQGLHVIFSVVNLYEGAHYAPKDVKDLPGLVTEYATQVRDKPALLGWYISDEPSFEQIPKIQAMYDRLARLDPQHPAFQVLIDPGVAERFLATTDVIGTDPYPIGKSDLQMTTGYTRLAAGAARGAKSVWIVPQIMDWAVYRKNDQSRPPSLDEMRNQAYQAIIAGAKGLIFYSYFDLWYAPGARGAVSQAAFDKRWPDVAAMAGEISGVIPAILEGEVSPMTVVGKTKTELRAIQYRDELLLLVANPYYQADTLTLNIPTGWTMAQAQQGQIGGTEADDRLTLSLPAVGSGVFRLVKP